MEFIGRTKFILTCWKHFNADLRTRIQVTFFFQQMSAYDAIHRPKVAISSFHWCIWKLLPCIQKPQFFSVPTTILPESSHGQSAENSIWPALHFPTCMLTHYECWLITCIFKTQPHQICFAYMATSREPAYLVSLYQSSLPLIRAR